MTSANGVSPIAHASIEEQHRIFEDKIVELEQAVQAGKTEAEIEAIYKFLREYAKHHFKEEERLMAAVEYPHLKTHVDLHDTFIQQLMEMKLNMDSNGSTPELYVSMVEFMKKWHEEHVRGADEAFVVFMQTGQQRNLTV
jgi:hemerythrin